METRHRSLQESLDLSYQLLNREQQEVLRAASVFKGGAFAEAAKALIDNPKLRWILSELCEKGWLSRQEVKGRPRFYFQDTASRQYAMDKLLDSPEGQDRILAHAKYFSDLLREQGKTLKTNGQVSALKTIELEQENIYAAMQTIIQRIDARGERPDAELLLPFAIYLATYADMVGRWKHALSWYQWLARTAEKTDSNRLKIYAQLELARFIARTGRSEESAGKLHEVRRMAEAAGDQELIADCANHLGVCLHNSERLEDADRAYQESLQIRREIGDRYGTGMSLNNLGLLRSRQQRYQEAEKLYQQSLEIAREIGNQYGIALALGNMATIAARQGRDEEVEKLYQESLRASRHIGNRYGIALALNNLGVLSCFQGRYREAELLLKESLRLRRQIGGSRGVMLCLTNLATLDLKTERPGFAQRQLNEALLLAKQVDEPGLVVDALILSGCLLAALDRHKDGAICLAGSQHQAHEIQLIIEPMEQEELAEGMSNVKQAVPEQEFAELTSQAQAMTLQELVDFALQALKE